MATYPQRWSMILEGALNKVPTAAQMARAGEAIAATQTAEGTVPPDYAALRLLT